MTDGRPSVLNPKVVAFLAIAVLCLLAGAWYRHQGGYEPPLVPPDRPSVRFVSDDPGARAEIAVTVRSRTVYRRLEYAAADEPSSISIDLRIVPSQSTREVNWVILTEGLEAPPGGEAPGATVEDGVRTELLGTQTPRGESEGPPTTIYYGSLTSLRRDGLPSFQPDPTTTMRSIATIPLGDRDSINAAGYAAAIPGVSASSVSNFGVGPEPVIAIVRNRFDGSPRALAPTYMIPVRPSTSDVQFLPYYRAQNLDIRLAVSGLGALSDDSQSVSSTPSGAVNSDGDLFWHGADSLLPAIRLAFIDYQQTKSNADFYSGLAFATAVSALLAALQEPNLRRRPTPPRPRPEG